jgi:hypothetical protein
MLQKGSLRKFIPLMLFSFLFVSGDYRAAQAEQGAKEAPAVAAEQNVYKGKVVGRSNKAKTISVAVGKEEEAKNMMVKFDDQTQGLEFAVEGEGAIIEYKQVGNDRIATVIKPKVVQLPQGTAEVLPDYVAGLIDKGATYFLVDSRPAKRFAEGSLPTAVNIPVAKLEKEGAAVLPADKNTELIFFCGGVT